MVPGEYRGSDGRIYRWVRYGDEYEVEVQVPERIVPESREFGWGTSVRAADVEKACEALRSLRASMLQHIPLDCFEGRYELVIAPDGEGYIEPREQGIRGYPAFDDASVFATAAYRIGLERGRAGWDGA